MATDTKAMLQATAMMPSLTVDDVQASLRFFEGLGFAVDERWEEDGALLGVSLRAGDVLLGLSQDDWKKGRDRRKGVGMRIYISARGDIEEIARHARDAGVELDRTPYDTDWGGRAFDAIEPSGFLVTVTSKL